MFSSEKSRLHSCAIHTKFVRILYEFHVASTFTHIHSHEICTKFVRISCEFHYIPTNCSLLGQGDGRKLR